MFGPDMPFLSESPHARAGEILIRSRQFLPDGSVLRGFPNPQDIGLAQINVPTWGKIATKLSFDLV
jgi:hypothetical protein